MAFADSSVYFNTGDSSILGSFFEKSEGEIFEFSKNLNDTPFVDVVEYPHLVWVTSPSAFDSGYRYANVKKGIAYIVVDEDDEGNPVIEKWDIKQKRLYEAIPL